MVTHPAFYVGLLKPYHPAAAIDPLGPDPPSTDEGYSLSLPGVLPLQEPGLETSAQQDSLGGARRDPPRSHSQAERPNPPEMFGQDAPHLPDGSLAL
ncbi:unnamed protein product [Phytophthora fragariaefolia]|uniref:Unnamed protein product n=1 Tax=Phytophthora fragariaefolia TaxID=1490495 RepID=A0A9W6WXP7_9STRA|nr:unnamed protein product [Phytophthora fragariaefolia]